MSTQFNETNGSVSEILLMLERNNLLTPENRLVITAHATPRELYLALSYLQEAGILTQENFAVVAAHTNPRHLAYALSYLQRAGILTEANRAVVAAHANPENLASALYFLQQDGILTEANRAVVAAHANPSELAFALSYLQRAGILTQENRAVFATHANPVDLANALSYLRRAGILNQANLDVVIAHANPEDLAYALYLLQQAGILTEENFAIVTAHANRMDLAFALSYLQQAEILTQENFTLLLAPNHAALLSEDVRQLIWDRIPEHLLTQANFQRLLTASEHANPMAELQRVRDQILGVQAQAGHAVPFNQGQSTHTASVHRSVSESASKLMDSYGKDLNIESVVKKIIAYVNDLASSPKHDAAKRCITRIAAPDYTFTDSSGVSTRQLLALAFTAIHDETKRQGTLEDARALFVEGLYEIQRGYNLNENNIDDKSSRDGSICDAGTFNKLMEKLNGIHPDVEVYFITHEGAYVKFPKVVAKYALNYLNRLTCPETVTGYLLTKALLEWMQDNGLEPVWDKIKADVEAELWDEFKEAYANIRNHPQFRAMIDNGYYSDVPHLSSLYSKLEASPGYQAFLYQLEQRSLQEQRLFLGLQQHSLWANRHENANAQHDFDRRYGLAIRSNID